MLISYCDLHVFVYMYDMVMNADQNLSLFFLLISFLVDPNILVTRSMPVSSIYRIKELSQIPATITLDCVVTRGIQIRSVTSEVSLLHGRGSRLGGPGGPGRHKMFLW